MKFIANLLLLAIIATQIMAEEEDFIYKTSESYIAGLEARLSELEERNRSLNRQVENLNFERHKATENFTEMNSYYRNRFENLENQLQSLTNQVISLNASNDLRKETNPFRPSSREAANMKELDTYYENYKDKDGLSVPKVDNSPIIQEEYNNALKLFGDKKYYEAELALEQFISKYPKNELIGDVYYWLAESLYKRNMFENAATYYSRGYRASPTSTKAPDNLFKLALSLSALGRALEACSSLYKLKKEFPSLPSELNKQIKEAQVRFGCKN